MVTIDQRPSRTVDGSSVSNWVAASNPIVFGFYNASYTPDPAYQINVKVYESGTDKLLGKLQVRPFTNGRVKVDVSGILRGYLNNENPFAYDVVNLTAAAASIKFYLVYEEVVVDASQVTFSGFANSDGHTRMIGSAPKFADYLTGDDAYLFYNDGTTTGPFPVIGHDSKSNDVILDMAYIDGGKPGKLSLLSPAEKFVSTTDLPNKYWAVLAAKQPGDLYGQNMGEYVPFQVEDLPDNKRAKWLTEFTQPVYWSTWPWAIDFIYGEGLNGIQVNVVEQTQDRNGNDYGGPIAVVLDATQIETVNRLTLSDTTGAPYDDAVSFVGLSLKTGDFSAEYYVAPGYVEDAYVEVL
jgi:hypothetical protein